MLDDQSISSYAEEEPNMWNGDEYSNADDTTISESVNNQNKRKNDASTIDNGYFCIKQKINNRRVRIEGYSSAITPGVAIRNAVTGIYETNFINNTKHAVGTPAEDLYFKVTMVLHGREPKTLFYDNIDQYERHFRTVADNETARKWHEKNFAARQVYEKRQQAYIDAY